MNAIYNLSQLLDKSQCQYKIFDLGRRIQPIEQTTFLAVEAGAQPYPYPLQRHAHLAIAYWNQSQQPWIWFLKFPLDERGLLRQTDVGNFLKYVTEAMGVHLSQNLTEEQQQHLANNPYTFKPNDDKMAVFHSQLRASLNLATSQYYEHAQHYFSGDLGWKNWQTVGLQGISDMCARLSQQNNGLMVKKALPTLAADTQCQPALYALLGVLEHIKLPDYLAKVLVQQTKQQCQAESADVFLIAAYLRALSAAERTLLQPLLQHVLQQPHLCHAELLIAIAGRCWSQLANTDIANLFLLRLAQNGDQSLFNQVFADLVMLPELRMVLLPLLHNAPDAELAQALLALQQQTKTAQ